MQSERDRKISSIFCKVTLKPFSVARSLYIKEDLLVKTLRKRSDNSEGSCDHGFSERLTQLFQKDKEIAEGNIK